MITSIASTFSWIKSRNSRREIGFFASQTDPTTELGPATSKILWTYLRKRFFSFSSKLKRLLHVYEFLVAVRKSIFHDTCTDSLTFSSLLEETNTVPPSNAIRWAMASPMPCVAPRSTTFLPTNLLLLHIVAISRWTEIFPSVASTIPMGGPVGLLNQLLVSGLEWTALRASASPKMPTSCPVAAKYFLAQIPTFSASGYPIRTMRVCKTNSSTSNRISIFLQPAQAWAASKLLLPWDAALGPSRY